MDTYILLMQRYNFFFSFRIQASMQYRSESDFDEPLGK